MPDHHCDFVSENTSILPVPLVPEIKLHLAHEAIGLWEKTEENLEREGLPPPFWAFAWAGGQALARYVLDNPALVCGRSVLDLATGSGLVAIAAAMAGAAKVLAADIDEFAISACGLNARLNEVAVVTINENLLAGPATGHDVVLCGDLFYDKAIATPAFAWLKAAQMSGSQVLIGDPGRSYLPQEQLEEIAAYSVPVTRDLEDSDFKHTRVWQILPD